MMFKRILIFLWLILFFSYTKISFAQEKTTLPNYLIASTFKTLAKTYVAMANIENIKKSQMDRIKSMSDEKFKKHFKKVHSVVNSLPSELKVKYGFKGQMSKTEVIERISELDKKKINQMIDDTPDAFITSQFKQYLADLKQDIQQSNIVKRIHEFWSKITPQAEN